VTHEPVADAMPAARHLPAKGLPRPVTPLPVARPAPPAPGTPAADRFPAAPPARMRRRHWGLAASFALLVLLPVAAAAWYLWAVALDQYASRVGFSVQREDTGSAVEILGGITELSGNSSADTDILYEFIQSQALVRLLDDRLGLTALYTRPGDPVFSMPATPTIEDVEAHWARKVDAFYDTASRLIEVRVLAFTPEDALRVAEGIHAESTLMLNAMSAAARADATRHAREELDLAEGRLRAARQALTAFRVQTQIVDPAADVQGRMGLLNTLLAQQATALIDLDMLASNTGTNDQRLLQAQKRVEVIENRIRAERARFGDGPAEEDRRYADLVAEFEALSVDLEFAQESYLSARATYDAAVAEAQRQSRYLATYLPPTLAERAEYPQRALILGMVAGGLFALWSILALVYYALRDRR
jgi:capsular polysaccharide transport system permease protein